MSRYIDKDKLLERLKTRSVKGDCKFCIHFEECAKINSRKGSHLHCWEMIDMHEADVVEVKHGKWSRTYAGAVCTACGIEQVYECFNYCPNCGAKMDGDI